MHPTTPSGTPVPTGDFDWAAPPGTSTQPAAAAHAAGAAGTPPAGRHWLTGIKARMVALAAAGAIVGGGVALAVDQSSGSGTTAAGSASQPGAGGATGGSGFAPGSSNGTAGGTSPTAYRLSGTVTAVNGSTVTLKTGSGSKTYTVTSSTHLQRNGSGVSLASFQVGDSVVGSTTTSGGSTLNDLLAGMGGMGG